MKPHRKRPARRKVAKKAPAAAPAPARPTRVPPRANRPKPNYSADEGVSFMTVLMGIVALALAIFVILMLLPAKLDKKIAGYKGAAITDSEPRNLLLDMQDAAVDTGKVLEVTEAEMNRYIAMRVKGEQQGTFGGLVKYQGTYVDLRPGVAEFFIERKMFGLPLTMSCVVTQSKDAQDRVVTNVAAGSIGRLKLGEMSPKPILVPFLRLWRTVVDDADALKAMSRITLEEGKVTFGRPS